MVLYPTTDIFSGRKAMSPIGKLIKDQMDKLGIEQQELAEKAGVAQSTISRIISGKQDPSRKMLYKLAGPLQLAVGTLLDRAGTPVTAEVDPEDAEFWALLQSIRTDADKARLLLRLKAKWEDDPTLVARIEGFLDGLERR